MVHTGERISTPAGGLRSGDGLIVGSAPVLAPCPDCIGGVSSCCEVHDEPLPEPPA